MNTITLEPARPTEADARQVMAWRNDPVTRAVSFHRDEKVWESFWPEYRARFFPADAPGALFVLSGGERVGVLSFARADEASAVEISSNLAPEHRGQGFGVAALCAVEAPLRAAGVEAVYAEVRAENVASHRAFEAAGYVSLGEAEKVIEDTGERCRVVRYRRELGR